MQILPNYRNVSPSKLTFFGKMYIWHAFHFDSLKPDFWQLKIQFDEIHSIEWNRFDSVPYGRCNSASKHKMCKWFLQKLANTMPLPRSFIHNTSAKCLFNSMTKHHSSDPLEFVFDIFRIFHFDFQIY